MSIIFKSSFWKAVKFAYSLSAYTKKRPSSVTISEEHYIGVDGKNLPLRVLNSSKNKSKKSIILFPGASPTAEKHPAMEFLGGVLANLGYKIFVPQIPHLKNLDISGINIPWIDKAYKEIINRPDVDYNQTICMGISYGGSLILKASLDGAMKEYKPKSMLLFGSFYDINTSLEFITTGKIVIKGEEKIVKPSEWGLIVGFHNYLSKVDVGFDTSKMQEVLKLRVREMDDEAEQLATTLPKDQQSLIKSIFKPEVTKEIQNLIDIVFNNIENQLNAISPKSWCGGVDNKVFIMHGAGDDMVPYTESVKLNADIPDSELFISYLYEHNEIAPKRSFYHKIKELFRLILFYTKVFEYNDN